MALINPHEVHWRRQCWRCVSNIQNTKPHVYSWDWRNKHECSTTLWSLECRFCGYPVDHLGIELYCLSLRFPPWCLGHTHREEWTLPKTSSIPRLESRHQYLSKHPVLYLGCGTDAFVPLRRGYQPWHQGNHLLTPVSEPFLSSQDWWNLLYWKSIPIWSNPSSRWAHQTADRNQSLA